MLRGPARSPVRGAAVTDDIYPSRVDPGLDDFYRQHGMEPSWTRVWRNGRDVTDEDPSTWVWPWGTN
jgi:hypothetical protein